MACSTRAMNPKAPPTRSNPRKIFGLLPRRYNNDARKEPARAPRYRPSIRPRCAGAVCREKRETARPARRKTARIGTDKLSRFPRPAIATSSIPPIAIGANRRKRSEPIWTIGLPFGRAPLKRASGSAGASAGVRGACEDPVSCLPQRPPDTINYRSRSSWASYRVV